MTIFHTDTGGDGLWNTGTIPADYDIDQVEGIDAWAVGDEASGGRAVASY